MAFNWTTLGGDWSTPTHTFTGPTVSNAWLTVITGADMVTFLDDVMDSRSGIWRSLIKRGAETTPDSFLFYSSDYTGDTSLRPKWTIDYNGGASQQIFQPDPTDGLDTYLSSVNPNTNYGDDGGLAAGVTGTKGDFAYLHTLFQVNMSALIAETFETTSKLEIYVYNATLGAGGLFSHHRLTQADWVELEATWNVYRTTGLPGATRRRIGGFV